MKIQQFKQNNISKKNKNIIKNNNFHNIRWQNISQTDQKKLPCLAVKACQLIKIKVVLVLENPLISIQVMFSLKYHISNPSDIFPLK